MNNYKKIKRKLSVVIRGIRVFQDWPTWLGFRIGLLKRDTRERIFRMRNGATFYFNAISCAGAGFFQEIYLNNEYFHAYSPREGDTVIDIGAHIGIFSVNVAQLFKNIKVFAYEPAPNLFKLLQKNIHANGLEKKIYPVHAAVSAEGGHITYYTDNEWSGITDFNALSADNKKNVFPIDVPAVTLKDIIASCGSSGCDFLKMDCEGEEFNIILHTPCQELRKIRHMSIEYHRDPQPLIDYLQKCKFIVMRGSETSNGCGILYATHNAA